MRDTVKVLEQDGQTEASALVRNSRRLAIRSESTYIATFFSLILNEGHVKLCKTFARVCWSIGVFSHKSPTSKNGQPTQAAEPHQSRTCSFNVLASAYSQRLTAESLFHNCTFSH